MTVSQLTDRLQISYRRGYRLIHQGIIPADAALTDPVYLIRDDPALLEQIETTITKRGWKRKAKTKSKSEMS